MKRKNGFGCWICSELSENTTLVGGYHARICQDHRNDWHVFVREHELMLERDNLIIEGRLAAERLDEEQMKILMVEMRKNSKRLYDLGKLWVEAAIISHGMEYDEKEVKRNLLDLGIDEMKQADSKEI